MQICLAGSYCEAWHHCMRLFHVAQRRNCPFKVVTGRSDFVHWIDRPACLAVSSVMAFLLEDLNLKWVARINDHETQHVGSKSEVFTYSFLFMA